MYVYHIIIVMQVLLSLDVQQIIGFSANEGPILNTQSSLTHQQVSLTLNSKLSKPFKIII